LGSAPGPPGQRGLWQRDTSGAAAWLVKYHDAHHIQCRGAYTHTAAAPNPEFVAVADANAKRYTGTSDWRVQPDRLRPAN